MNNDKDMSMLEVLIYITIVLISVHITIKAFIRYQSLPAETQQEIIDRSEFLIKNLSDKFYYNEVWQKQNRNGQYKSIQMRSL